MAEHFDLLIDFKALNNENKKDLMMIIKLKKQKKNKNNNYEHNKSMHYFNSVKLSKF